MQERFERLLKTQEHISRQRNDALVGSTVELTIERTSSKKDEAKITGRTRTNKLVHLAPGELSVGDVVTARITDARAHHLVGRLCS